MAKDQTGAEIIAVPEEHEVAAKGKAPHDPNEINPKMSSDIHYWAKEFNVTGAAVARGDPGAWDACEQGP